ncbi:hypothetical protein GO684_00525 [Wolbachia endosymbiont of Litomosoides brasiliensis]|nr:hypothetical protein [Wolbachia endosymbiont of Litomosoides brasiliensis]NUY39230.1 hypothetical protein [Wolbachia endosymbiont of Litomosoides brasiliensis]
MKEKESCCSPQFRRKTGLDQSQFEQVEVWIRETLILPLKNEDRNHPGKICFECQQVYSKRLFW